MWSRIRPTSSRPLDLLGIQHLLVRCDNEEVISMMKHSIRPTEGAIRNLRFFAVGLATSLKQLTFQHVQQRVPGLSLCLRLMRDAMRQSTCTAYLHAKGTEKKEWNVPPLQSPDHTGTAAEAHNNIRKYGFPFVVEDNGTGKRTFPRTAKDDSIPPMRMKLGATTAGTSGWTPGRRSFDSDELIQSQISAIDKEGRIQPPDSDANSAKLPIQVWYADDGSTAGRLGAVLEWASMAVRIGPKYGYHLILKKCILTTPPQHLNQLRSSLKNTPFGNAAVGTSTEILGAFIGTDTEKKSFIDDKVQRMASAVSRLADVGSNCPQALHVAYTKALQHRTTYLERTTASKDEDFAPIAMAVKQKLMPAITGRPVTDSVEDVLALPVRLGGLALSNPT